MTGLIVLALIVYFTAKAVLRAKAARAEANRKKQIAHLYSENKRRMQEAKEFEDRWVAYAKQAEKEQERLWREQERERKEREREEEKLWKEQLRLRREQEKQAEQIAKHDKRISDLETKIGQAEYDISREIENLNHYAKKLSELDEELNHANWEIESWKKQRHLANVAIAEKKREKIEDKIFSWENKVRMAEKRLDKAERTKESAQREIEAA